MQHIKKHNRNQKDIELIIEMGFGDSRICELSCRAYFRALWNIIRKDDNLGSDHFDDFAVPLAFTAGLSMLIEEISVIQYRREALNRALHLVTSFNKQRTRVNDKIITSIYDLSYDLDKKDAEHVLLNYLMQEKQNLSFDFDVDDYIDFLEYKTKNKVHYSNIELFDAFYSFLVNKEQDDKNAAYFHKTEAKVNNFGFAGALASKAKIDSNALYGDVDDSAEKFFGVYIDEKITDWLLNKAVSDVSIKQKENIYAALISLGMNDDNKTGISHKNNNRCLVDRYSINAIVSSIRGNVGNDESDQLDDPFIPYRSGFGTVWENITSSNKIDTVKSKYSCCNILGIANELDDYNLCRIALSLGYSEIVDRLFDAINYSSGVWKWNSDKTCELINNIQDIKSDYPLIVFNRNTDTMSVMDEPLIAYAMLCGKAPIPNGRTVDSVYVFIKTENNDVSNNIEKIFSGNNKIVLTSYNIIQSLENGFRRKNGSSVSAYKTKLNIDTIQKILNIVNLCSDERYQLTDDNSYNVVDADFIIRDCSFDLVSMGNKQKKLNKQKMRENYLIRSKFIPESWKLLMPKDNEWLSFDNRMNIESDEVSASPDRGNADLKHINDVIEFNGFLDDYFEIKKQSMSYSDIFSFSLSSLSQKLMKIYEEDGIDENILYAYLSGVPLEDLI